MVALHIVHNVIAKIFGNVLPSNIFKKTVRLGSSPDHHFALDNLSFQLRITRGDVTMFDIPHVMWYVTHLTCDTFDMSHMSCVKRDNVMPAV